MKPTPKPVTASYHSLVRGDVIPRVSGHLGRVLDFGGGTGATSSYLKAQGRATSVVVADIVSGDLADGVDDNVVGDLNDLQLIDRIVSEYGPFDTILCLDVLEHLYDPWEIVRRLSGSLSHGGRIIASIPNVNYIGLVGPLVLAGKWELQDDGVLDRTHIRWFTKKSSRQMFEEAGLSVTVDGRAIPKYRLLDVVTLGLFRRFFVMQYLFFATKNGS